MKSRMILFCFCFYFKRFVHGKKIYKQQSLHRNNSQSKTLLVKGWFNWDNDIKRSSRIPVEYSWWNLKNLLLRITDKTKKELCWKQRSRKYPKFVTWNSKSIWCFVAFHFLRMLLIMFLIFHVGHHKWLVLWNIWPCQGIFDFDKISNLVSYYRSS